MESGDFEILRKFKNRYKLKNPLKSTIFTGCVDLDLDRAEKYLGPRDSSGNKNDLIDKLKEKN